MFYRQGGTFLFYIQGYPVFRGPILLSWAWIAPPYGGRDNAVDVSFYLLCRFYKAVSAITRWCGNSLQGGEATFLLCSRWGFVIERVLFFSKSAREAFAFAASPALEASLKYLVCLSRVYRV